MNEILDLKWRDNFSRIKVDRKRWSDENVYNTIEDQPVVFWEYQRKFRGSEFFLILNKDEKYFMKLFQVIILYIPKLYIPYLMKFI
jgi:hypothetical protein